MTASQQALMVEDD